MASHKSYSNNNKNSAKETEQTETTPPDIPAFLCSAANHTEADMIESMLRSSKIPVMKKWRNGGDALMVIMSVSSTGVDLYVPSSLLEEAKTLLFDDTPNDDVSDELRGMDYTNEADCADYAEDYEQDAHAYERRTKAWLIFLVFFVLPPAFAIIALLLWQLGF